MDNKKLKNEVAAIEWQPSTFQAFLTIAGFPVHLPESKVAHPAWITLCLCILMFALAIVAAMYPNVRSELAFVPASSWFTYTWITSLFVHAGFIHLFSNLYFFCVFGRVVEYRIGSIPFTVLFLLSGIVGNIASALFEGGLDMPRVGASGAIFGVITYGLFKFRVEKFGIFFFGAWIKIASLWLLVFFVVLQIYGLVEGFFQSDNVSHVGHLGGAIAGLVYLFIERLINLWMNLKSK